MGFQYALADANGLMDSGTIATLSPGPTFTEYPTEQFKTTIHVSVDGNPVTQSFVKDDRPRKWVWQNYRETVPGYTSMYNSLLQLHYKLRLLAGDSPWVFLKEDVTDMFGKYEYAGGTWSFTSGWIRVKVIDVFQEIRQRGGRVVYDTSGITFVIDDSTFNMF